MAQVGIAAMVVVVATAIWLRLLRWRQRRAKAAAAVERALVQLLFAAAVLEYMAKGQTELVAPTVSPAVLAVGAVERSTAAAEERWVEMALFVLYGA